MLFFFFKNSSVFGPNSILLSHLNWHILDSHGVSSYRYWYPNLATLSGLSPNVSMYQYGNRLQIPVVQFHILEIDLGGLSFGNLIDWKCKQNIEKLVDSRSRTTFERGSTSAFDGN